MIIDSKLTTNNGTFNGIISNDVDVTINGGTFDANPYTVTMSAKNEYLEVLLK